ncbi:MAG TPA: DUF3662 and FHA domain-containing protein [Thermoleophilaceae bacterium]|jgi:hypothetical protein
MSVLRSLEAKLEAFVEGAFSRAFKSRVQPVELARKLAKEMEESQVVSVSRTYVSNEYVVFLSPGDREQFASYEGALRKELSDYLLEHARGEGLALVTRPTVEFKTDDRLGLGEFGIQAHLIQPPDEDSGEVEPRQADYGHTMVYSPDAEARRLVETPAVGRALLVGDGRRTVLSGARVVLGRSRDCDVVLDDPNVSRRHAELRRQGETWMVADLGSTNGVKVNGRRVEHAVLKAGDEITLGLSRLSFEQE